MNSSHNNSLKPLLWKALLAFILGFVLMMIGYFLLAA